MMGACVKLVSPRKRFLEAATFLQAQIQFYPLSILVVQNIGYIQLKKDADKNINIHKMTKRIYSNTILYVTDDKIVTNLLVNFKCIIMAVESGFPF